MQKLGQITGLLVALDRREDELDRPFRRQAFHLKRVGKAQAADGDIRALVVATIKLLIDILTFAHQHIVRQRVEFRRHQRLVQEGGAHFQGDHAKLGMKKAGKRDF